MRVQVKKSMRARKSKKIYARASQKSMRARKSIFVHVKVKKAKNRRLRKSEHAHAHGVGMNSRGIICLILIFLMTFQSN